MLAADCMFFCSMMIIHINRWLSSFYFINFVISWKKEGLPIFIIVFHSTHCVSREISNSLRHSFHFHVSGPKLRENLDFNRVFGPLYEIFFECLFWTVTFRHFRLSHRFCGSEINMFFEGECFVERNFQVFYGVYPLNLRCGW